MNSGKITLAIGWSLALCCASPPSFADNCGSHCGQVATITPYTAEGKGSGVGVIAGGVTGALLGNQIGRGSGRTLATIGGAAGGAYVGNKVEKKVKRKKMEKVVVTLDNGTTQSFRFSAGHHGFATGDRVQIRNGKLTRYTGQ